MTALKKIASAALALALLLAVCCPLSAVAAGEGRVVRVGWHEEPYFITDAAGRRSGYTYEYLQKLAAYTGWTYEYVKGGWSELVEMLKRGEIDLMGNMSYMEERAKDMLYASFPMGTEAYYVLAAPDNADINAEDYASLNGKTVGVAKGSIQSGLFLDWAAAHGVRAALEEMATPEEESLLGLGTELDAFVTMDVHADPASAVPVWKIGSSDFFFAVSKDRPDLLAELNAAMSRIQDENKYYSQELYEKYLKSTETNLYLTTAEKDWLDAHGPIRVGYQDHYLAFCQRDENTGELIGALKDYLDYAASGMENARLDFEPVAYPTAADAIAALQSGEVDCVFPANLSAYDSELLGVVMTPALMKTEMDAVVRASDQKKFSRQAYVSVAVNRGNTNYELFLLEHFPGWEIAYFADTPAGLDGVAAGDADCVVISNYRFSNIAKQCEKLHLTTVYTGVDMDYYLAVRRGDTALYSILAKTTAVVPGSTIHAALTYYSTEDAKTSFLDVVRENLVAILLVILIVVLLNLTLLFRSIRAERKADDEERLINSLNKQVFVDALTHVRNKGGFDNYMAQLQERLDSGEELALAIGVLDCDNLKIINDRHGHEKGNLYLTAACRLICKTFQHSPVFRIGGDEFALVLQGEDYENRAALIARFEAAQRESLSAPDPWDQVSVATGLAEYDPRIDASVGETLHRADQFMYENKRKRKNLA